VNQKGVRERERVVGEGGERREVDERGRTSSYDGEEESRVPAMGRIIMLEVVRSPWMMSVKWRRASWEPMREGSKAEEGREERKVSSSSRRCFLLPALSRPS